MGETGMQRYTFASYKKKIQTFLIERSQHTLNRESAMVFFTLCRLHSTWNRCSWIQGHNHCYRWSICNWGCKSPCIFLPQLLQYIDILNAHTNPKSYTGTVGLASDWVQQEHFIIYPILSIFLQA